MSDGFTFALELGGGTLPTQTAAVKFGITPLNPVVKIEIHCKAHCLPAAGDFGLNGRTIVVGVGGAVMLPNSGM